jgi:hypothetical protein
LYFYIQTILATQCTVEYFMPCSRL